MTQLILALILAVVACFVFGYDIFRGIRFYRMKIVDRNYLIFGIIFDLAFIVASLIFLYVSI